MFERNKRAFQNRHPEVWRLLEGFDRCSASIEYAKNDKNPFRIGFSSPDHCNLSPVSLALYKDLTAYFRDAGFNDWTDYPEVDVGYAFVFGVGLGRHIPDLAARNLCRHLVLIEPSVESFAQSLSTIDWQVVFKALDEHQATVHFLISLDASETANAVDEIISHFGATFIEGSYFIAPFSSPELEATEAMLKERIKNHYASSGYFEDELKMIQNCHASIAKRAFRLISPGAHEKQETPIFIVGSGASLDNDLPVIKKWRDRAVVLSCGSALGVLLKNGVRPDLHVENENTCQLVNNLKGFQNKYGLEDITFVGSMTISPELDGLFDAWWLYFRPVLSSTTVMAGDAGPVDYSEPLVSNAGFAVSVELGFQNIYLFGVDCGRKPGGAHHSKQAVYYDEDYDNFAKGEGLDFIDKQFDRQTSGNFGGKFMTSWALDLSRHSLASCQREKMVNLVNCSDGALIEGAKPARADDLDFSNFPEVRKEMLSQIESCLPSFGPGEYLKHVDFAAHAKGCETFADLFPAIIDAALKEDSGFWLFEQRLEKFWADNYSELKGVLMVIGGSYASMVRLGAFFGNRMGDQKARLAFFRFFLGKYRDVCLSMAKQVKETYKGFASPT